MRDEFVERDEQLVPGQGKAVDPFVWPTALIYTGEAHPDGCPCVLCLHGHGSDPVSVAP